jgi:hypothetical protein
LSPRTRLVYRIFTIVAAKQLRGGTLWIVVQHLPRAPLALGVATWLSPVMSTEVQRSFA